MKKLTQTIFFTLLLCAITVLKTYGQARLTIQNNSQRTMTVKIMRGFTGKGTLHQTVSIGSYGSAIIQFTESDYYFTKSRAVLQGKDPIYRKGQPFQVTNDSSGYSVMTITFSIKESSVPQATGGKQISKTEFDQN